MAIIALRPGISPRFSTSWGGWGGRFVFGVFVVYFVTCLAVALSLAPAEGQGHPRRHVHLSTSEMVYILGDEVVCERALYERGKS